MVDDNFTLGRESFSVSNLKVKTYLVFFFIFLLSSEIEFTLVSGRNF